MFGQSRGPNVLRHHWAESQYWKDRRAQAAQLADRLAPQKRQSPSGRNGQLSSEGPDSAHKNARAEARATQGQLAP